MLRDAEETIAHNAIKHDWPVIIKLHPAFAPKGKITDTLVLARLIASDIDTKDTINRMDTKLSGRHSLEAWGVRLGFPKQDYTLGFDEWNETLQLYCENDVEVGFKLYHHLISENYSQTAIDLEHAVAAVCARMERNGYPFDIERAGDLYAKLSQRRETIKRGLKGLFKPWQEVDSVLIPKRDNKTRGYTKGVPVTKYKVVEFNPASRQHIAKCLTSRYGWKPTQFTPCGSAKVDETVLGGLKFPEAQTLAEYFTLNKLIGQLGEGQNAWLKLERNGRIHGAYNPNGAVTGRATHSYPNIAQIPSVDKPFGPECRALFGPGEGYIQLGSDMSGLELRCLAHYMAFFDDGAYARELLEGDIHTANQEAAGLPSRNDAKRFIYAFL